MRGRFAHGGNMKKLAETAGLPEKAILDFSASINPLGPPEWLRRLVSSKLDEIAKYPDPECLELLRAAEEKFCVPKECVVAGNGATEILHAIPRVRRFRKVIIPSPAYSDYGRAAMLAGLEVERLYMREEDGFRLDVEELARRVGPGDLVFLCEPNNPTGNLTGVDNIRRLAEHRRDTLFVVDESFLGFLENAESLTIKRSSNVIVVISLTKLFAIPGLRLGLAVADPAVVSDLREHIPPWSVNALAQAVGAQALEDKKYVSKTMREVAASKKSLLADLSSIREFYVYPGAANFVLTKIKDGGVSAATLAQRVLEQGVAIRVCDNFEGLDDRFFRVAVRSKEENRLLVEALRRGLEGNMNGVPAVKTRRKKPAVMFQGTGSNVGKSLLAAAFCRILKQDGYNVAPFKAQNMSLNSYVTMGGGEMGRAQVLQAQACGIEPDTRMNPILLKPADERKAQVIVNGKPAGVMDFNGYTGRRDEMVKVVDEAYDSLAGEYDALALEGAGSPAEVNLKDRDIVNMRAAKKAAAPVLIVGDIDRGGVFASFIGVMETLAEWERALVAGFVINKFRGDDSLLAGAIDYTESHTNRPILGVVPYVGDLFLPDEDRPFIRNSVRSGDVAAERVEIAIVRLGHVSNFTDFDPLMMEPDVNVVMARRPEDINGADAVILPGSKNVIDDLAGLRESGMALRIAEAVKEGAAEIIGICGGFQMMGEYIDDASGVESGGRGASGMGVLPVRTTYVPEKRLRRVQADHLPSGLAVKGYEIHHGETDFSRAVPLARAADGEVMAVGSESGMAWGSYMHGMFDSDDFRRWFIDRLRVRKGLKPSGAVMARYDIEGELDRLAEVVRRSLRVKEIYRLMGLR